MKILLPNKASRGLLIGLMAAHVFGTLFAYIVYINFSSLGDGYHPEEFQRVRTLYGSDFASTVLVWGIYYFVSAVLPGILAPMFLGMLVALLIWRAFRYIYAYVDRKIFWICNLFPHFLVWSGSSSKEQIVIICGILVISFVSRYSFGTRPSNISFLLTIFALGIIFIIRPNYFVIYFTIFLIAILAKRLNASVAGRFSFGVWIVSLTLSIFTLLFILTFHNTFFSEDVVNFMLAVQDSFLSYEAAGSNRTNIRWNVLSDFFYNALWGIPQGFIGPTFFEILSKPIQAPAFLEGLIYLLILFYLLYKLLQLSRSYRPLRLHILPFIFVGFCIIFVSYPYLIFNPGSALRYKQSLHPLLVFYPLLILAYFRAKQHAKTKEFI